MADVNFTKLDFEEIKDDLITYLKSQDKFKDYDYDGSNMAVLLDVLSYNTWKNNFYTNMAMSEMFLDSAKLRQSVVSHAKELNYLPRSKTSAKTLLDVTFSVSSGDSPATVEIPARTPFLARCNSKNFTFYNEDAVVITPNSGEYVYEGLEVFEGRYINEYYEIDSIRDQELIINNDDVDISSVRIYVAANSEEGSEEVEYIYKDTIYGVESDDKAFYIEPHFDGLYRIRFGQGVFGADPVAGNVVRILYRITNGARANGIANFGQQDDIGIYPVSVSNQARTVGGADAEDNDSIKFFAPKSIQVQNRAITEEDYTILLKNRFPEIQAVSVFGGEELFPPQYGRVVVTVDVNNSDGVSETTKNRISSYLSDKTPIGVEPIITTAKFMYAKVTSTISYNINGTSKSRGDIETLVRDAISNYSYTKLEDFRKTLRYSKLITAMDDSDASILSNSTVINPIIALQPVLNQKTYFTIQFGNELNPDTTFSLDYLDDYVPTIWSSDFTVGNTVVSLMDNGNGNIYLISTKNGKRSIVYGSVGTVDYTSGDIRLDALTISDYTGGSIKVYANIKDSDIATPKNRILSIADEDVKITVKGLRV